MKLRPVSLAAALALAVFARASSARADEISVTTAAALVAAIGAEKAGDVLTLADGVYAMGGATCAASGSVDKPITVRSATPLGARIEFDALEGFLVKGAHWHFEGLDVRGVCATDDACEHAFHVVGGEAEGFVLRRSRVRDFNAQLKVNAAPDGQGKYQMANHGLVEYSELADTHPRATGNPVTKLNIDGGLGWIVRGNYLHDFRKAGGNKVSYGAFMKSGGAGGLFERNLVACSKDDSSGGVRIGLSFGGGGTGPQYCAPAFDANVPCAVEHTDGVMRNNLIVGCSDVGIYVNRGKNTRVLFNTLVATSGIDFRFDTTTGEAHANLLMGKVRSRDGAAFTATDDRAELPLDFFTSLYADPLAFDFAPKGDTASLQVAAAHPQVSDDYCAAPRPVEKLAVGALEHSLGGCDVLPPPEGAGSGSASSGGSGGAGTTTGSAATTGSGGAGGEASSSTSSASGGDGTDGSGATDSGCTIGATGSGAPTGRGASALVLVLLGTLLGRRKRRVLGAPAAALASGAAAHGLVACGTDATTVDASGSGEATTSSASASPEEASSASVTTSASGSGGQGGAAATATGTGGAGGGASEAGIVPAVDVCAKPSDACAMAPVDSVLRATYRKDVYLPQYVKAGTADPKTGGRFHVAAIAAASGDVTEIKVNGAATADALAKGKLDWVQVWPRTAVAGEPVWVAFHSRDAAWDSASTGKLEVATKGGMAIDGTFPVAKALVPLTYVTTTPAP
jgi:hypothetical protein